MIWNPMDWMPEEDQNVLRVAITKVTATEGERAGMRVMARQFVEKMAERFSTLSILISPVTLKRGEN